MTDQTVLVTGGFGCIGAETTKWILANSNARVIVASRSGGSDRIERVFGGVDPSRFFCVPLDVRNKSATQQLITDHGVTRVVHMAALQTPDCNAHRDLGLQINLAGTQNVIEAMKDSGKSIERFIYASSAAVYGPRASYPTDRVAMLAQPQPVNVYGAWKLAAEHVARFFCDDTNVPTICLRPGVLYGPGRDAGLTSSPTTAMKCLALGRPYTIPFRSRQDYQFAPDIGSAVGHATMDDFSGYAILTMPSLTLDSEQIVDAVRRVAPELGLESGFDISVGSDEVPFICDLEFDPFLEAFPNVQRTPLDDAVRTSLRVFRDQIERGWLTENDIAGR